MKEKFVWHEGDIRLSHKDIEISDDQRARANERIDEIAASTDKKSRGTIRPVFKDTLAIKEK
jgi:hypothetical protein